MMARHRPLVALLLVLDGAIVACAWPAAYWLRFYGLRWRAPYGIPDFDRYLAFDAFIAPMTMLVLNSLQLYARPRSLSDELSAVVRGVAMATVTTTVASYFTHGELARTVLLVFAVVSALSLCTMRL